MFGDLDWPRNASRRFVSISWASCYTHHRKNNASDVLYLSLMLTRVSCFLYLTLFLSCFSRNEYSNWQRVAQLCLTFRTATTRRKWTECHGQQRAVLCSPPCCTAVSTAIYLLILKFLLKYLSIVPIAALTPRLYHGVATDKTRIWHVPAKHANRMDARAHTSTLAECAPRFLTPRSQGFVGQSSWKWAQV